MESDDYVGRYGFEVEPFQEDYTGRLSWGVLGNLLLRCASLHSAHYGFGYNRAEEDAYAWVLSRLVIELDEMPRTGEQFTVETWVAVSTGFFRTALMPCVLPTAACSATP